MAEDYYNTLGVPRDASSAQIQKAYRDLARKYHPDLNPNDKTAKEKFKKVQAAFDILNDEKKRKMYDQYGPAFEQMPGGAGPGGGPYSWTGEMPEGFEGIDISQLFGGIDPAAFGGGAGRAGGGFADFFEQIRRGAGGGAGRKRGRGAAAAAGADLHSEITIPFNTAVLGGEAELRVDRGRGKIETITVKIPPGIADGGKIRLRGQGQPGSAGGPAGDILLTVHVAPHPYFTRADDRLDVKLPVTLSEAILGAKVDVPTPYGTISLRVPPRTSSGTKLRVKGHGVKHTDGTKGDLYAEVQIILPDVIPPDLADAVRNLQSRGEPNPRRDLRW